ncbi:MAG: hypothetical protein DWI57_18555 [Chloroflexi bacterium]|nr:MAG: hypothetical protein DWI57_18555 [Chloroflexota bacterium]
MNRLLLNWRVGWLVLVAAVYLLLAGYQLGLPGLHYDEAREAGVNALELLTGAPVTAFRGATITLWGRALPLMVQDYIGALNVYLALPFLALTGIGVPNLRFLPLLLGLLALFAVERAISAWMALTQRRQGRAPISLAALCAVTLLAASPTFVFWNRQGIFVTNATLPCTFAAIWWGVGWLRTGSRRHLLGAAFAAGLALYAKLLTIWLIGPFALLVAGWWLAGRWRSEKAITPIAIALPPLSWPLLAAGGIAFLLPLLPFLLFNQQTGGTFASISGNLDQSYYGVDNRAIFANLPVRLGQIVAVLRGEHLWYLGGVHANSLAPWLAAALVVPPLFSQRGRKYIALPGILLCLAVLASLFTVSDLFITHYALLHPLLAAVIGSAVAWLYEWSQRWKGPALLLPVALLSLWLAGDLSASLAYHQDLARSGGLADHSDASYHLAYYLRYNGLGAPIALDWGLDAPIRYLSAGTVTPIELFGYASLAEPDPAFVTRIGPFLDNPDNIYLLHAPGQEIFRGRRAAFFAQAKQQRREPLLEQTFAQRDGVVLVELWRLR